ncbi:MAG: hypothetical protein NPIRA01_40480 [Nitrospirales bacterium]|nr:MAG: hypothetical protein NPIRA01_40480 [Nitrospirales bacterium]
MFVLHIDSLGTITCPYTEEITLTAFGTLHVERASHIEWDTQEQAWTITLITGHRLPGLFPSRQDALTFESDYVHKHFSELSG